MNQFTGLSGGQSSTGDITKMQHQTPMTAESQELKNAAYVPKPGRSYCVISPVRDEADYVRRTLDSVIGQTEPPLKWVIVDDGSSDETPDILAEYAAQHDFISIVRRERRKARKVGGGVIEAFYAGYDTVDIEQIDFICKLDMDLVLTPSYFASLMDRMEDMPQLGTCSGKPYYPAADNIDENFDGTLISEGCGDETSIGASKFYRLQCFRDIGGFVRQVMWDGIDCHRCRMTGWIARSWDDPDLRFIHLRPMGSSDRGILTGRMRHGYGQWYMGTGFVYLTASAIFRMFKRPVVIGGLAIWLGYINAMIRRNPRYDDPSFRHFLRQYHWRCLLKGKKTATAEIDQAILQSSIVNKLDQQSQLAVQ